MQKNKVIINNEQNIVKIPTGLRLLVRKSCIATLRIEQFHQNAEINVTFIDNHQIKILNKQYRQKDIETDVLSFPMTVDGVFEINRENGNVMLGDVVISLERAVFQAEKYGHSLEREVSFLTVHAVLHLLGYDHEKGGLAGLRMREKEEEIMTRLGVPRSVSNFTGNL